MLLWNCPFFTSCWTVGKAKARLRASRSFENLLRAIKPFMFDDSQMEHSVKTLGHVLNCPVWFQGNSLTLLLHCYFLIVNVGIELKVNKRSATFTKADHQHSPKWNNGKWPKNLLVCTKVSVNVRPLFLSLQAIVKWIKITTQAKWKASNLWLVSEFMFRESLHA